MLLTNFGTFANVVTLQGDGKIIAAGYGSSNSSIARFNTNGSYDTSFGSDGKVETDFDAGFDTAKSIAFQPDGKFVVGESDIASPNSDRIALARYFPNGSLDSTFDGDGKVTLSIGSSTNFANSGLVQGNGRIVVAGGYFDTTTTSIRNSIVRYNTDGTLDSTFDGDGIVVSNFRTINGDEIYDHAGPFLFLNSSSSLSASSVAIQATGTSTPYMFPTRLGSV